MKPSSSTKPQRCAFLQTVRDGIWLEPVLTSEVGNQRIGMAVTHFKFLF